MSVYGAGTILQLTAVEIVRLLTATIIYLKCLNTGTIPRVLLKTMIIQGSVEHLKKFYINP